MSNEAPEHPTAEVNAILESLGWKPAGTDRFGRATFVGPWDPRIKVVVLTTGEVNATCELADEVTVWSADGIDAIRARCESSTKA
jgi:hypothetical protein